MTAMDLAGSPGVSYSINADDRILTVSEGWVTFAAANDAQKLLSREVLGTYLWDWIADEGTRKVYHSLVQRVREARTVVRFEFRCDSPTERRLLLMEMLPEARGQVTFQTSTISCDPRRHLTLLDKDSPRSGSLLKICGWCARIRSKDSWLDLEQAISELRLFDAPGLPTLSHGICPTCYDAMLTMVDKPDEAGLPSIAFD